MRELHELYIQRTADAFAQIEKDYIERLIGRLLGLMSWWWLGRCTAINVPAKTATVLVDPPPTSTGLPPVSVSFEHEWGRESWTAAQLVGKRVRVGYNQLLNYRWIIDTVTHE